MKLNYFILILLILICSSSCQDDVEVCSDNENFFSEGIVTFSIEPSSSPVVQTRSGNDVAQTQEPIENVAILVFYNSTGELSEYVYQATSGQNTNVSVYMDGTKGALQVFAVCNLPKEKTENITTLNDMYAATNLLKKADDVYQGSYIMTGGILIEPIDNKIEKSYEILVKRIVAFFDLQIRFAPDNIGDRFEVSNVYLHRIPKGSFLMEKSHFLSDGMSLDSLNVCTGDYMYDTAAGTREGRYFSDPMRLDIELVGTTGEGTGIAPDRYQHTSFYLYENRQGGVQDIPENWPDLNGLYLSNMSKYKHYQQIYKKGFADNLDKNSLDGYTTESKGDKGFPYASYVTIHGIYQTAAGRPFDVSYTVYLGSDNYKDFNVRRNYFYQYMITIRAKDHLDTRVWFEDIGGLVVYSNTEEPLDSHCNVVQALMYAPQDWTVRVENPDITPWLEVSTSQIYKPNLHGSEATGNEAGFRLNGKAGLQYFYIHTDDYIPQIKDPKENNMVPNREGYIVCESGRSEPVRIKVTQLPARLVRLHIDYDIHLAKPIDEDFFVENKLEQKYMPYGFLHYWSFITDDLIAAGQWDGLANTRRLYQVATEGDKWGVEPAYPDGIPYDHALGYVLSKNRDRNGNGKIDPDEIMWYWAAANELQALVGHVYGGSDYYPSECAQTLKGLGFEEILSGNYHSSSPSVADPAGITPGSSYYVNMGNGKKWIGQRDRRYNVIAARRAGAWKGPDSGNAGGNVDEDGDDLEDEEVIMPK